MLVVFVKPPVKFLAIVSPVSPDKRYALLALGLMFVYLVILAVPLGRTIYGLELLATTTLAIIALSLVVWVLLVMLLWRKHSVEKFLGLEPVPAKIRSDGCSCSPERTPIPSLLNLLSEGRFASSVSFPTPQGLM